MTIERKTLSFVKGKGSLTHNNRTFVADNVDPARISWNVTYVKESLEEAYEKCFGDAIRAYNAGQKRKDRRKHDYITEIRNSKNKEKVFYENVVMIGTMKDTGVVDGAGHLTLDAATASQILDQYAKSFQERNPNLYLFNAVLHMDEATPHLHLDYIPVASGCYKTGLKTRNSLTKAFQCMGFEKASGKYANETMAWQEREREYLSALCRERGIEIVKLEENRADLSLPEYKAAMKEIEDMQEQADEMRTLNSEMLQENEGLMQEQTHLLQGNMELQEGQTHLLEERDALSEENEKLTTKNAKLGKEIKKSNAVKRDFEQDVRQYRESKRWQLPEPTFGMTARSYKEKKAAPLVSKLIAVIEQLTLKCQNMIREISDLKSLLKRKEDKIDSLEYRVEYYKEENESLRETAHDMDLLKGCYGTDTVKQEISRLRSQEQFEKQMRKKSKRMERDTR